MIYLLFMTLTMLFIYNTELFELMIIPFLKYIKKKPLILGAIAVTGDALYMIGGGIIAGLVIEAGLANFTIMMLLNNYGTIMIVVGAITREYFKSIRQ